MRTEHLSLAGGKSVTNASDIKGDKFEFPSGIVVDDEGNVYVGDIGVYRSSGILPLMR